MLDAINSVAGRAFDLLLWPTVHLGPAWSMLYLSAVIGIACVWVFGRLSNQTAIGRIKDRISGNLIGVRLFQHDLGVVMSLQGSLLWLTLRYMLHSLAPMLVLAAPMVLILAQMNTWYGARPFAPNSTALLKVEARDEKALASISLLPSADFRSDASVRVPAEGEIAWRLRALEPGSHSLVLRAGDQMIEKSASIGQAGQAWSKINPVRSASWTDRLLYPGEPALDSRLGIERVTLSYPPQSDLAIAGIELHWLLWFFILTLVFGFAVKGALGVKI